MRAFPQYKFVIMAFLDMMFSFLSTFPQPHLGGDICNAMNQVVLPFNMIGSIIFMGTRYHAAHWIGAFLAIVGVIINLIPLFNGTANQNDKGLNPTFGWVSLNAVSYLFMAASNIYKEIALKDHDLDVWYANAWVCIYQLLWGLLTIWTVGIPAFVDPSPTIPMSLFGQYILNGIICFFGYTAVDVTNTLPNHDIPCNQGILLVFGLFIFFNVLFNMLMLYTFKSGSSVLFVISSAIALPLSDILYTFPAIAGSAVLPFTVYDGVALLVLVLSMSIYYSKKEERVVISDSPKQSKKFVAQTPVLQRASRAPSRESYGKDSKGKSKDSPF